MKLRAAITSVWFALLLLFAIAIAMAAAQTTAPVRARPVALTAEQRVELVQPLLVSGWQLTPDRDALVKTFVRKNFVSAFGLMTQVAMQSEKLNHHPEWSNIYKTVRIYECVWGRGGGEAHRRVGVVYSHGYITSICVCGGRILSHGN